MSRIIHKGIFFGLLLISGPLPYFPPSAYMKGSLLCPVCTGREPKGFHRNGDPAVLSSGVAEHETMILDPGELTASLCRAPFAGRGWDTKPRSAG